MVGETTLCKYIIVKEVVPQQCCQKSHSLNFQEISQDSTVAPPKLRSRDASPTPEWCSFRSNMRRRNCIQMSVVEILGSPLSEGLVECNRLEVSSHGSHSVWVWSSPLYQAQGIQDPIRCTPFSNPPSSDEFLTAPELMARLRQGYTVENRMGSITGHQKFDHVMDPRRNGTFSPHLEVVLLQRFSGGFRKVKRTRTVHQARVHRDAFETDNYPCDLSPSDIKKLLSEIG